MAEFGLVATLSLQAAADLSAVQYHVVRHSALQSCNVASDNTNSAVFGVLQNKPKSTEFASVAYVGKTKAVAGAAIALPAIITHNSSGRVITVVSGSMAIGRALEAASADGDIITVVLGSPAVGRWAGAP